MYKHEQSGRCDLPLPVSVVSGLEGFETLASPGELDTKESIVASERAQEPLSDVASNI